jgi:serine/threonine protein kinase
MGVVHRATHDRTGQIVALKTVRLRSPELIASFRREVHALASLSHPGIVRIFEHGVVDAIPWYAMELGARGLGRPSNRGHIERLIGPAESYMQAGIVVRR